MCSMLVYRLRFFDYFGGLNLYVRGAFGLIFVATKKQIVRNIQDCVDSVLFFYVF